MSRLINYLSIMAVICSCTTGISNFGQPECVNAFARASRLIYVNYRDNSGAINSIASTDTLDSSYIEGKLYNTDKSQRWYLTGTINDVTHERGDAVTQDVDGLAQIVRQGQKTFNGTFWGGIASPKFVEALDSIACRQMGVYIVDVEGNLIGIELTDGSLAPIKIQRNTIYSKFIEPTADQLNGVMTQFNWEENERDSDISYISSASISVDLLSSKAMTTVTISNITGISTTTATFDMAFVYGEFANKEIYTGAVSGDFTFADSSSTPILITSVTENPAGSGTYDLVFPVQSSGTYSLSYQKTTGAGFETVEDAEVVIP
jgi:hypothetical protein